MPCRGGGHFTLSGVRVTNKQSQGILGAGHCCRGEAQIDLATVVDPFSDHGSVGIRPSLS